MTMSIWVATTIWASRPAETTTTIKVFGALEKGAPIACKSRDGPVKAVASQGNGALAQLGERLHGMQEVSGSIPLGSTIPLISLHI